MGECNLTSRDALDGNRLLIRVPKFNNAALVGSPSMRPRRLLTIQRNRLAHRQLNDLLAIDLQRRRAVEDAEEVVQGLGLLGGGSSGDGRGLEGRRGDGRDGLGNLGSCRFLGRGLDRGLGLLGHGIGGHDDGGARLRLLGGDDVLARGAGSQRALDASGAQQLHGLAGQLEALLGRNRELRVLAGRNGQLLRIRRNGLAVVGNLGAGHLQLEGRDAGRLILRRSGRRLRGLLCLGTRSRILQRRRGLIARRLGHGRFRLGLRLNRGLFRLGRGLSLGSLRLGLLFGLRGLRRLLLGGLLVAHLRHHVLRGLLCRV